MGVAWDDLRTVLMLVRYQTLAAAAAALDVNYTTVARRIRRAEASLGQVLFERLADGYRPTEAARVVASHAEKMETSEFDLRRYLQAADTDLTGRLTITAPQLLLSNFLAPVLEEFDQKYPQIELRVLVTNDILDMTRLEADLAIRISRSPGDTLKGLRLLKQENACYASSSVARRIRSNPTSMIDWIVYDVFPNVPKGIDPLFPNNRVRFRFDDMVAMLGAAQAGLGVVRTPMFIGRSTAGLEQVSVLPPQPYSDIWVVGHPDVWPSKKLRAFRNILVAYCKLHSGNFRS
jgi:DNA-binding transcriptional LysR family regulator